MSALRPPTLADVGLWASVINDPATRAPFDWFGFATARGMRHRIENRETITDTRGQLAIADADGGFVGEVTWFVRHWRPAPESSCWQLGILVLPAHRGQGHGGTAQALLADYLFARTQAERLEAATEVDNAAERRALRKAGFAEEGTLGRAMWRDASLGGLPHVIDPRRRRHQRPWSRHPTGRGPSSLCLRAALRWRKATL